MIQLLATKYNKVIAYMLWVVFYMGLVIPVYGLRVNEKPFVYHRGFSARNNNDRQVRSINDFLRNMTKEETGAFITGLREIKTSHAINKEFIDGPSQPEMASFKSAGTSDLVNLFTGDFSYNIPLLDVGGYPVNIYYSGGITMEQEASWVGLGWNINPGNINRNMRGVPDDFNGEDTLVQEQNMKKNTTWGVSVGGDLEVVGIKNFAGLSLGASLGFSVNNYLGPAVEAGIKGGASFSLGGKSASEKGPIGASIGLSANVSSRNGLTFSGNASLSAKSSVMGLNLSQGIGLSTSYNSRTGIKGLQLSEQVSASYTMVKGRNDNEGIEGEKLKTSSSMLNGNFSTSISFMRPSYVPVMRSVITNSSGAGRFQLGLGMFGISGSLEIEGYGQKSEIASEDRVQKKPMVGYLYAEKAEGNRNAVMDFTRFNDKEVTPSTTVISVPQYAYDVFSIQGEGTGGAIRFYRNDNGYVRDNFTGSKDKSWSAGVDIGIPGHIGANFNTVKTPSTIGEWNNGNKLRNTIGFTNRNGKNENVYFRNPGENSVLQPNQYDSIGGTDLVRYKLGGTDLAPTIESKLQKLNPDGSVKGEVYVQRAIDTVRKKRTQVTSFLTAKEASDIGLDKKIKVYDPRNFLDAGNGNELKILQEFKRDSGYRKSNHISQINVTEADGKRYIYGIPVYNLIQKDFSFTVADNCSECDTVPFNENEATLGSSHISGGIGSKDGYTQITTTPPYAHSFLLSGLLSPDYVDVTGDGITEDDLGGAIKFNYTKTDSNHKWRTPLLNGMLANSNPGNLTEKKDDKGIVSFGVRESWYLHSIESKTMIAFFKLDNAARADGKGALDTLEDVNGTDTSIKSLKQIDLYNKADLKKNGLAGAKPVKTVHFDYSYSLCNGTPDNPSNSGKLTLQRIWFTYNGQTRNSKNQYLFSYASGDENPDYVMNASDRWGNYKPRTDNPQNMMNRDFPYAVQDKTKADQNANAWALKKILLPSGGQMEITYESDDYAFVQDRRAAVMSEIIGFSNTSSSPSNRLYETFGSDVIENDYLFVKVTETCNSKKEVFEKYLKGVTQLAVKLTVNMPKGMEHLISYATFNDYGVYSDAGFPAIWIKMNRVNDVSPLSLTTIEFLRQQLPGQAFDNFDMSESEESDIEQVLTMMKDFPQTFGEAFSDMVTYLRKQRLAQAVQLNKSFVRVNDPDGFKYGGGQRVKMIVMKDNWKKMVSPNDTTKGYTSSYGLEYNYTTTEIFNGVKRTISSGVASYEPSIGGEENPFQTIIQLADKVPLGPTSYGAIEMPVMDAFFPAPLVGYSKVTVTSIGKKQVTGSSLAAKTGIGKQVTEFYTAKDFPVYYNYTPLDAASNIEKHINPTLAFFYKYAFDGRAISQGFLVATNDMHGKTKSQSSYAEYDSLNPINYTQNFYRNTGINGLEEKFDFIYNDSSGKVQEGNMGIDIELMTDTREFTVKSKSKDIQAQVDWMLPAPLPIWLPFIWATVTESENVYRAVTTTKVISYHAVLDSVVVIDKGSQVSTKNLVYDAETGQVIVNRTNNEFEKPIYSVNYPAYWAYSGMGLAYKNIDAFYTDINFTAGEITGGNINLSTLPKIFESGDELYIVSPGGTEACDPSMVSAESIKLIWAMDKTKDTSSLTSTVPAFIFIDSAGRPYTRSNVSFRIVRSGKRNMLGASAASITMMAYPVDPSTHRLVYNSGSKVINASAIEYKEKWQADADVIRRYTTVYETPENTNVNIITNGDFSSGNTGFTSEYTYNSSSGTSSGVYNVNSGPTAWNSSFPNCGDHTGSGGKMLMVNGSTTANEIIWSQTVSVIPGSEYFFSAWATRFTNTNPAQIKYYINGTQLGSTHSLSSNTCVFTLFSNLWNSGINTTATITIVNGNVNGTGNDFAIDDIAFITYSCNEAKEVADCSGYLEKRINPYRKGLIGNFKSHRSKVFYGERSDTSPTGTTNLVQNGFLASFNPYWNFNASNNLVPDVSNTKWVWNNEITRFNSKGMELETKNALNIYTAAQYGYHKTLPVAIANNSRYHEMFAEGFEDAGYDETLNGAFSDTCKNEHINFSSIYNAGNVGINAHTGQYVLGVPADTSYQMNLQVIDLIPENFGLKFNKDTLSALYNEGLNVDQVYNNAAPFSLTVSDSQYIEDVIIYDTDGVVGMSYHTGFNPVVVCYDNEAPLNGYILTQAGGQTGVDGSQYIEINHCGNYVMNFGEQIMSEYSGELFSSWLDFDLQIRDLDGNLIKSYDYYIDEDNYFAILAETDTLFLDKGVYQFSWSTRQNVYIIQTYDPLYPDTDNFCDGTGNHTGYGQGGDSWASFSIHWPGATPTGYLPPKTYKTLDRYDNCITTKPIAAKDSMLNPVFTIPQGKKMLFSGWIKQDCSSCTSNVTVDFDNGSAADSVFFPSGPVIEGWQRIEGVFTAPDNISATTLKFINTGESPIYFDDIRIHPFNANMQSYVYDPVNLRLTAQLDANNYASFYEYDEEGTLIRTKVETREGVKTVTETRSAKQKNINDFQ